ncbi:hypothetical protein GGI42DRAFT_335625, partial [Trichoderma sp. SZMC 28013]
MKRKLPVRRPSTSTPPMRPKADHRRGRDHQEKNNSLYSKCTRLLPPSFRMVREDQKYSLLDVEDIQSSTRVDSMALLGTKARDEYYRNDSPVGDLL